MTKWTASAAMVALLSVGGCADFEQTDIPDVMTVEPPTDDFRPTPTTSGGVDSSFEHPDSVGRAATSVEEVLARMSEVGPPEYSARVHSCRKMPYRTLGRVLSSLGVDLQAEGERTAGAMYRRSAQALGAPNYQGRISETTELTAAAAGRLFDIFVQASPEIIANVPELERCQVGGEPTRVFNDDGSCSRNGLSCLVGQFVSEAHVELCDDTVSRVENLEEGQQIAVASLLSAMFTCE